jgi:tRNA pseudouridine13 synthase
LNPVAEDDPEGKFRALRVELQLGASAYATMALREVTREETATWWQIGLTVKGEDQKHKGRAKGVFGNAAEGEEAEGEEGEEVLGEDQLGTMPE